MLSPDPACGDPYQLTASELHERGTTEGRQNTCVRSPLRQSPSTRTMIGAPVIHPSAAPRRQRQRASSPSSAARWQQVGGRRRRRALAHSTLPGVRRIPAAAGRGGAAGEVQRTAAGVSVVESSLDPGPEVLARYRRLQKYTWPHRRPLNGSRASGRTSPSHGQRTPQPEFSLVCALLDYRTEYAR